MLIVPDCRISGFSPVQVLISLNLNPTSKCLIRRVLTRD
jgi:hypothetical protein